jgi:hypothetical protein
MIRDEAMANAIACAEYGLKYNMPSDLVKAKALAGELWLGIADRLPAVEPVEPDASPVGPAFPDQVLDEVRTEDEEVVIAECGHRMMPLLHRGRWLHPYSLDVCDDPPVKRAEK